MTFPKPPPNAVGQLVEHAPTHTVVFTLGSAPPAQLFRVYVSLPGPAVANANSGSLIFGQVFQVLTSGCSLAGYSTWCCNSGQDLTPVNYALWHLTGVATATLIPAATMTGGPLTAGQFNDAFLPAEVPLTAGSTYVAQQGITNGFPLTNGYWSSSGVGYDGMTNSPLQVFSDQGGSRPAPAGQAQNTFTPGTNDPTSGLTVTSNGSFNVWFDQLISTG